MTGATVEIKQMGNENEQLLISSPTTLNDLMDPGC